MNSTSLFFRFLLLLTGLGTAACASMGGGESVSAAPLWIDVRTPDEYRDGHAEDAILIPYTEIADRIEEVAPDKRQVIHVYCRSGRRSDIARQTLESLGYQQVTNVGGLEEARRHKAFVTN